jgi:hypothetical protein
MVVLFDPESCGVFEAGGRWGVLEECNFARTSPRGLAVFPFCKQSGLDHDMLRL